MRMWMTHSNNIKHVLSTSFVNYPQKLFALHVNIEFTSDFYYFLNLV